MGGAAFLIVSRAYARVYALAIFFNTEVAEDTEASTLCVLCVCGDLCVDPYLAYPLKPKSQRTRATLGACIFNQMALNRASITLPCFSPRRCVSSG